MCVRVCVCVCFDIRKERCEIQRQMLGPLFTLREGQKDILPRPSLIEFLAAGLRGSPAYEQPPMPVFAV